jgi:3-phosphoshikimate 1-carboxyvinyltransferase
MEILIKLPGSKSISNRMMLLAAFANTPSSLRGVLDAWDTQATWKILQQLGAVSPSCELTSNILHIRGLHAKGSAGRETSAGVPLTVDCGYAGTLARFLPGLLLSLGVPVVVDGQAQLRQRPLKPYLQALQQLGGSIRSLSASDSLPLWIEPKALDGGEVRISGTPSSQFVSGVLMAAPFAREEVRLWVDGPFVQPGYIHMTVALMKAFGVTVASEWHAERAFFRILPQMYRGVEKTIEPDASTAGYFWAWAFLHQKSIRIGGLSRNSLQPDIALLNLLEEMGAKVSENEEGVLLDCAGAEWSGGAFDLTDYSDQWLTLAILAVFGKKSSFIRGIAHTRFHESNRPVAMALALRNMGIVADWDGSVLAIEPGYPRPFCVDPHRDHRIAMAISVLGTKVPGISVLDTDCIGKTAPAFLDLLLKCERERSG